MLANEVARKMSSLYVTILDRNIRPAQRLFNIQLRIDGNAYVAKKLVNVGSGRSNHIPISQAVSLLTADLIRLRHMAYFAGKFQLDALDQGIDIAGETDNLCILACCLLLLQTLLAEFDVSEGFLMKIYKSGPAPPPAPAPASAADESELVGERPSNESADKSPEEVTGVYMVEPMRLTPTVVKFSGTLGSTTRTDLRSSTMAAFAHYVAQATACQYIFADIQGARPRYAFCGVQFIPYYRFQGRIMLAIPESCLSLYSIP